MRIIVPLFGVGYSLFDSIFVIRYWRIEYRVSSIERLSPESTSGQDTGGTQERLLIAASSRT